ncbi:hypothetical protein BOTBODRAFT_32688 [Botryobasidium botryosum FD-172 SS1]|uniref:Replication protein A subunit n=1 Tax=Botryobasidium botryosum (strain FD-172 SS1) TaxID=930990 RepID=A0A067MSJ5_BOTB1|nr:hypothetical protein BOTBODRAFT_32688 [Botryobasidium botryosum FD-172 SS1]
MSKFQLTGGACSVLMNGTPPDNFAPTMQVLSLKQLQASGAASDRYRIIISDGGNYMQAMLAVQLNDLVHSGSLAKHSVITLDKFACNDVQDKRIAILLAVTVLGNSEKIGDPVSLDKGGDKPVSAVPSPATNQRPAPAPAASAPARTPAAKPAPPPRAGAEQAPSLVPIAGLSPYQNKWTIRARVTQKSDIRTWSNARGEGKLFSVNLMDETGEIKATGFNAVVDSHYDQFEEGKVYYLTNARINLAKKQFSNLNSEYEISMEARTVVQECTDTSAVPEITYNFIPIDQLQSIAKDAHCDIIGVVHEVGPAVEFISKASNKSTVKREISIVDRSAASVRLTLWGKTAESFQGEDQPVIAFKGVKVGDYGGRSLSMFSTSTMYPNPDLPEAHELRGWYDNGGSNSSFQAQSSGGIATTGATGVFNRAELKTLAFVKESNLGTGDRPDFFSTRASIIFVKPENIMYPACASADCSKKVTQLDENNWRCEKCDKSCETPEWRYLLSFSVADHTSQAWLQAFNEVGVIIMGISAPELQELKTQDQAAHDRHIASAIGRTWYFACRAKEETFNDLTRVRYGVNKVFPVDYKADAWANLDIIKKY